MSKASVVLHPVSRKLNVYHPYEDRIHTNIFLPLLIEPGSGHVFDFQKKKEPRPYSHPCYL